MLYRFRDPINAEEAQERFTLVEERGDRMLVALADGYWQEKMIRPTFVCPLADLEVVSE